MKTKYCKSCENVITQADYANTMRGIIAEAGVGLHKATQHVIDNDINCVSCYLIATNKTNTSEQYSHALVAV